ncbi:MAG TPA: hypothetical protein VNO52_07245, partial [Methylomirabilota bacterium]|nr:hypothetical protein [Methylomirabilota bacterium]
PRSGVSRGPDWLAAAHHLLDTAEGALLEGRLDVGWSLIHEVERLRILGLDERDLLARAVSLRHEATEKLSGWRGQAVRRSLEAAGLAGEADEKSMPASCVDLARLRAALFEGQFVLNTHFNNRYHQLGLQGQTLRYLVYILVALVALILFYFNAELPPAAAAPINFTLMLGVMLFGALGGTLSAMFRFSRASTQKIPDAILDGWVTLGRPMIGAASAVFLHLVLSAGVLNLIESTKLTPPLYLAFAFVSGFSESLVLRTAERLGGGDRPGKS